jgi:hypothetical protein
MARMTKQELKHNEMADVGDRLASFYERHSTAITVALAMLLIAIIAWKGYGKFAANRLERINAEMGNILQNLHAAMAATDEAKRKELFQTTIADAERIARDYPSLPIGREAQLLAGNAQYYFGDMKAAQDAYQKYLSMALTPMEKATGQLAMGHTLENLLVRTKNLNLGPQAENAYKEVSRLAPGTYLDAEARFALARYYQNQAGRQNEARRIYESIIADRKLADLKTDPNEKPVKLESGKEMTPEELNRLRGFTQTSYHDLSRQAIEALRALPTGKETPVAEARPR